MGVEWSGLKRREIGLKMKGSKLEWMGVCGSTVQYNPDGVTLSHIKIA